MPGDPPKSFFPLTVNYQERTYAAGKIPGGYFKREGRPTEDETLISRLIDRPLRPLFPKGFSSEVQVIITLMSLDPNVSADVPALIGASAAVALSGLPCNGPFAAARVGYQNGDYLLNFPRDKAEESDLNLVVAGTKKAVLMVESEANALSEEVMLGAVMYGHKQMQVAIDAINELVDEAGKEGWEWEAPVLDEGLVSKVSDATLTKITEAYGIRDKLDRQTAMAQIREETVARLCMDDTDQPSEMPINATDVLSIIAKLEKNHVRSSILAGNPRIDGRDTRTVRDIRVGIRDIAARSRIGVIYTR